MVLGVLGSVVYKIVAEDLTRKGTSSANKTLLGVGVAMTGVGSAAKGMTDSINTSFLSFDDAMTAVEALGGTTTEQFNEMRDAALDLSREVPIAATDVADAMYEMISVGYDFETMMAVIPEATELAVGGNMALSDSVDAVINVFGAYGDAAYTAEEATNIFSTAVGVGKWELSDFMTEIMKNIGVAAELGISFEDLAAANVSLQNSFTSSEEAGTALKTLLMRLVDPRVIEQLHEMGVEVKDADGNFVGLESVLNQLDDALQETGGDVDRMTVLQQLFGAEGVRAAMALIGQKDALAELSAGMADGEFKVNAFNTVLESTSSQLDIATNSMDAAKIKMGEAMAPATVLAADAMGLLAGVLITLPDPLQQVAGLGLFAAQGLAGLGPLLIAMSSLKGLGLATTLSGIATNFGSLGTSIAGLKSIGAAGALANIGTSISGMGSAIATASPLLAAALPILAGLAIGIAAVYLLKEVGFLDWVQEQGYNCGQWLRQLGKDFRVELDKVGAAIGDVSNLKSIDFLGWVRDQGYNCRIWLLDLASDFSDAKTKISNYIYDLFGNTETGMNNISSSISTADSKIEKSMDNIADSMDMA
ncbi:phage tail tape measure protein, partial [bacterium]